MPGDLAHVGVMAWWVLPVALVLDALVGDPPWLPHPIRWMGRAIQVGEPRFRRLVRNEFRSGSMFAFVLIAATWAASLLLVRTAYSLHPQAGGLCEAVLIFYCLAARSLARAGMEIFHLLGQGDVDAARTRVAGIVGRDVSRYGGGDIARATVETVAENFVDGVFAPLCFAAIGGAPLALTYKMVNTLDSMVGYKNPRYLLFGRAAARIDDWANFLPARLSVPFIALAARWLAHAHDRRVLVTARKEGRRHSSPNAGYPEAAFAGALGVRLNGPNVYHGVLVPKPYIGTDFGAVETGHIHRACQLMTVATWLGGVALWFGSLVAGWLL